LSTLFVRDTSKLDLPKGSVVASFGNFDGLHLGHQKLLDRMRAVQQGQSAAGVAKSVILSFYPHPAVVLGKVKQVPIITTLRQRLKILSTYGIDYFLAMHFTPNFSTMSAGQFLEQVVLRDLGVTHLVTGPDASIGYQREGDVEFIDSCFKQAGCSYEILDELEIQNEKVSSRTIRRLIQSGRIGSVRNLLGRNFSLDSVVVGGDGRGKGIGFPTANLAVREQVLPAQGVYATKCCLGGAIYQSVTNIGVRPTFSGQGTVVEAHLLSYEGDDFYGERVELEFIHRIRDEKKFESAAELRKQIELDVIKSLEILK
jgi:riboflavin kinase / FMN adenylyltransferase